MNEIYKISTFPVSEMPIYIPRQGDIIDISNSSSHITSNHKAIVKMSEDGKPEKIISVMKPTYEIVSNQEVLDQTFDMLETMNIKYENDRQHTNITDSRMQVAWRLPEYSFIDKTDSEIQYQMRIHNSYDGTERVRLIFGFIRMVCTNGLVVNYLGETIFRKHTKNVQEDIEIPKVINTAFEKVDELKARLDTMNEKIISIALLEKAISVLGVRNAEEAGIGSFTQKRNGESEFKIDDSLLKVSQYTLLNMMTYQISHNIDMKMRYTYQQKIAKIFQI